jgi:hypothetical protein
MRVPSASLEQALVLIVRHIVGEHVTIEFPNTIAVPDGAAGAWGSSGHGIATAAGVYLGDERKIRIAMNDRDYRSPVRAALHECFHAVEDILLTDKEMRSLERQHDKFRRIAQAYADLTDAQLKDLDKSELRAIAFEANPRCCKVFRSVLSGQMAKRYPLLINRLRR